MSYSICFTFSKPHDIMARKKGKRIKPERKKVEMLNTIFFTAPLNEEILATDCFNCLTTLSKSTTFPDIAKLAPAGLALVKTYQDLVVKSLSTESSNQTTDQKAEARFQLVYFMYKIVWQILLEGDNDVEKMTKDSGFTAAASRTSSGPITVAPRAKYGMAFSDDPNNGTYALPIIFAQDGRPKGVRGSSYRTMKEGETTWSTPVNFGDNKKRVIPGLKIGDKGKLQVRYNGGNNGNGPWSEEITFVVAA